MSIHLGRRATKDPSDHSGLVLAVILAAQLMVVLDATIVNIALPEIKAALGFSSAGLSWVVDAYTLVFGGLLLLGARAGDLLGRRRTFLAGITLFTVASMAGGLATSASLLLAARAVQGAGAAFAAPSALALLMVEFAEGAARRRAIAWYAAMSVGGVAIGLLAGGMLTQWLSWRWVFFVNVPIGIAVVVGARRLVPETDRRAGRFDLLGALTSTLGMGAVVYGFIHAATSRWSSPTTIGAFVLGAALLAGFVVNEARAAEPITPLRLFADRNRSASYVARLLLVAGMYGMFFFLTQFLQDELHYRPLLAGLAFLPLTIALFAASQTTARVLSRLLPEKVLLVGGVLLSTIGLAWLTHLSVTSSYLDVFGPLVLFGGGNGFAFVPLTNVALAGVAPADAGAASGLVNVAQQVGGSLGLAVLVSVFGSASRSAAAHAPSHEAAAVVARHAFVVGADRSFLAAALFLVATVVTLALAIRRPGSAAPAPDGLADEIVLAELA
jgi:EmrB/QacA subfamily drug resistance transporter